MSDLTAFSFKSRNVRYIFVEREVYFNLSDVLIAINSATKPSEAEALINAELGMNFCYICSGAEIKKQLKLRWDELTFINESALTFYVTQSRTELGKELNQLIHVEILPSIRKTGSYSVDQTKENLEKQFLPDRTLKELDEFATIMGKRFGAAYEQRLLTQCIKKYYPDLPVIEPAPEEKASLPIEALLTPTQIAGELNIYCSTGSPDPRKVNQLLERLGYQVKVSKVWSATEKAKGLCDRKPVNTNSRSQKDQLLWSRKIIDILKEHVLK